MVLLSMSVTNLVVMREREREREREPHCFVVLNDQISPGLGDGQNDYFKNRIKLVGPK